VAHRALRAPFCLVPRAALDGLTDIIPPRNDVANPRGSQDGFATSQC